MFSTEYDFHYSTVHSAVAHLRSIIYGSSLVRRHRDLKLVFLCGANKTKDLVSERRRALIDFIKAHLPKHRVILAENLIEDSENLLEIEHKISKIADHVIIVLESESAFCELGAFANQNSIKSKITVINDKQFKGANSFINKGPLKVVEESTSKRGVLWYEMTPGGAFSGDGIGHVFPQLRARLVDKGHAYFERLQPEAIDPSEKLTKDRLLFLHDLIYLAGPLTHKSLIDLLKLIFGANKDYKNANLAIALLKSIRVINYEGSPGDLSSCLKGTFLDFHNIEFDVKRDFALARLRKEARGIYGNHKTAV
ncbi:MULTISPECIES: retron St85 family effector protein [Halorhodospira]|uniref:retron St85 family effector protein n=1 Tax=Halorhodospira TaxID=85108 RepID=UPI001EE9A8C6|nr:MULTISPECIES: retron St85 family effector protein [Halorhodospira]MCG5527741.1 retron St85 family effector protein [Halorhodospira halophila]MCG5542389.1 retron St85 family effector protein [Halorhodospira sp. 9628]